MVSTVTFSREEWHHGQRPGTGLLPEDVDQQLLNETDRLEVYTGPQFFSIDLTWLVYVPSVFSTETLLVSVNCIIASTSSFSGIWSELCALCPSSCLERQFPSTGNTRSGSPCPWTIGRKFLFAATCLLSLPVLISCSVPQALSCVQFPRASLLSVNNTFQCSYSRAFCILIGPPGIKMPQNQKNESLMVKF